MTVTPLEWVLGVTEWYRQELSKMKLTNCWKPGSSERPLVEVYIDDIVVKSKNSRAAYLHLQEVFYLLRNQRGIEVSPDQVKAVMETPPPGTKGVTTPHRQAPHPKGEAIYDLAVSEWAISAALFRFPSPKEQKPVYYVSRALADVETRPNQHHESSEQDWWTLRVDGASRSSGSRVGLVLQSPTGEHLEQAIRLDSPCLTMRQNTRSSLSDWTIALALSVSKLRIYSDSQLVVRHIQKEYEAKDSRMRDTWPK
ncbi:hypothetical protein CK203_017888 [Vitis vinifera]|uniref:RNase H type-1 domain-containing protein n=1 Tax=Vitis vinifera TaxID=29760 RepID=A0A438JW35_VITVI|nr:hypothetical protein CK203_017888 [Vitis vinifera]